MSSSQSTGSSNHKFCKSVKKNRTRFATQLVMYIFVCACLYVVQVVMSQEYHVDLAFTLTRAAASELYSADVMHVALKEIRDFRTYVHCDARHLLLSTCCQFCLLLEQSLCGMNPKARCMMRASVELCLVDRILISGLLPCYTVSPVPCLLKLNCSLVSWQSGSSFIWLFWFQTESLCEQFCEIGLKCLQ